MNESLEATVNCTVSSENLPSVFDFKGNQIRTKVINNEPMFCLADICKVLDLTSPNKVAERFNGKGVNTIPTLTAGGVQKMTFISEQNLYKVIFQSRKPEAESFADWVTGEVLPSIRKTGGYIYANENDDAESIMAKAIIIAHATIDRQKNLITEQNKQIEQKNMLIEQQAPKVQFVNDFCTSHGTILVRDFAKHISQSLNAKGFGEKVLFSYLKDEGYMTMNRYPTQRASDLGIFKVYEGMHSDNDGELYVHHCSKITPKGQTYLFEKIRKKFESYGKWW